MTEQTISPAEINKNTPVGKLATAHPLATRVFHRHGIDFCCGGGKALEDACKARNVEVEAVIEEINKELAATDETPQRWDEASFEDLVGHILTVYHQPLHEELPRLDVMARKVLQVHGDKAPDVLPELVSVFAELRYELEQHMFKEERVLFPMILQGQGSMALGPIEVMQHEHESAGEALRRLRELTNDYTVPECACNTWQALWHGLAALEADLQEHIHLENNILFPRALKS
jgi:regulator of cell morphogenesis and NO signaling